MARITQPDPRYIARNVGGIFEAIFPQMSPGVVAYLNRTATQLESSLEVNEDLVRASRLQHALLFELGVAAAEPLLAGNPFDWDECVDIALKRQRKYYDAIEPGMITEGDKTIALSVGTNLASALKNLSARLHHPVVVGPAIPGLEWLSSSFGDFAIGNSLIEVKCVSKSYGAADYRQVVIYWLMSLAARIESVEDVWNEVFILNPRRGYVVHVQFDELLALISAGRSKVEALELFKSFIGQRRWT